MGLGLFVVRRIVEAHGGCLEVQSALGQGSTFRVLLPLVARPESVRPGELWAPAAQPSR
jgi:signal transduction histidine kinase